MTYTQLTQKEALQHAATMHSTILAWIQKHRQHLDKLDSKYIIQHMTNNKKHPFGQFYVLYKIHKGQKNNRWPTRPVCSDVSSITHGLGKWVDQMLQPIAAAQHSYLKDSFALKEMICNSTCHLTCSSSPVMPNQCTPTSPQN